MYCPNCSHPLTNSNQFCSHCGVARDAMSEIVATNEMGNRAALAEGKLTPRQKGLRQGVGLILLSAILIPVYVLLAPLFPAHDRLVESAVSDTPFEKISQAVLLTLFLVGLVRTAYAWFFEKNAHSSFTSATSPKELTPAQGTPIQEFGAWKATTRTSGEL
jgi:hypothetical protein